MAPAARFWSGLVSFPWRLAMDLQIGRFWVVVLLLALALGCGIFFFLGRETASARKAVDDAADELTGNRAVRQGQEVKAQLKSILGPRDQLLEATQRQ